MKQCRGCKEHKPVDSFYIDRGKLRARCKECDRAAAKERMRKRRSTEEGRLSIQTAIKKWKKKNQGTPEYMETRRAQGLRYHRRKKYGCDEGYFERGQLIVLLRERLTSLRINQINVKFINMLKTWEQKQPHDYHEARVRYHRQAWAMPSTTCSKTRSKLKYTYLKEFAISERMRRQITKKIKRDGIADDMRLAIYRGGESNVVERTLGYTIEELKEHLGNLFTSGMSWDEFIKGNIHIDHVKPQSLFDVSSDSEYRKCWALGNLQPLWATDNLRKSDAY